MLTKTSLTDSICHKARLARDPRFDGRFFTAVTTTKIYCRCICPATPPHEKNVQYFFTASAAANAGYRPCLRCRPESAPGSWAWLGVETTLSRALSLIDNGALQQGSLPDLATRLGISDRYLRQLFNSHLGISPKAYALYQQCLFAKQLLHQTNLPISEIALASGFASIRRFNDYFVSHLHLTPSQLRISNPATPTNTLMLKLYYRPPYNWDAMHKFLSARAIEQLECCDDHGYGRTFNWAGTVGSFHACHVADKHRFDVTLDLNNINNLKAIVTNIRRVLDLNLDAQAVEQDLNRSIGPYFPLTTGLRLPGIWTMFEAGIRAILGQHISVTAARNLVIQLVSQLGQEIKLGNGHSSESKRLFPTPEAIANSELEFFKMPQSRKQALRNLAQHYLTHQQPDNPQPWLDLKGIGPWTVDYAKMRGLSDPDIFLAGDLGIKKALQKANDQTTNSFASELASPWRSYLTFQLWSQ